MPHQKVAFHLLIFSHEDLKYFSALKCCLGEADFFRLRTMMNPQMKFVFGKMASKTGAHVQDDEILTYPPVKVLRVQV